MPDLLTSLRKGFHALFTGVIQRREPFPIGEKGGEKEMMEFNAGGGIVHRSV
jgi:hypothetical protein